MQLQSRSENANNLGFNTVKMVNTQGVSVSPSLFYTLPIALFYISSWCNFQVTKVYTFALILKDTQIPL